VNATFQTSFVVRVAICGAGCGNGSGPVAFGPCASCDKRPEPAPARLEVEQRFDGERVRLSLNVGLDSSAFNKRVAVVVQITELRRHVIRELVSEIDSGREAIPHACFNGTVIGIDGTVPVPPIPDVCANFVLLAKRGDGKNNSDQVLHGDAGTQPAFIHHPTCSGLVLPVLPLKGRAALVSCPL